MFDYLTRGQVHKLSQRLKAKGRKLPKVGWCQTVHDVVKAHEVCRYVKGYAFIGAGSRSNSAVFAGAKKR